MWHRPCLLDREFHTNDDVEHRVPYTNLTLTYVSIRLIALHRDERLGFKQARLPTPLEKGQQEIVEGDTRLLPTILAAVRYSR